MKSIMTTRSILLTLAASVAPLFAQQPGNPQPTAQVFQQLAAPATPAAATPEQRAQVFGALALLPQDIADFAVLTNVGGNLLSLAESGIFPELDAGDIPTELLMLDNIALANSTASPATYALLRHALVGFSTLGSSLQLAEKWAAEARTELRDAIAEELILRADAGLALPEGVADGAHLPVSYAILTARAGEEAGLQRYHEALLRELRSNMPEGVSAVDDANAFSGIRIDVVKTYAQELEEATADMAPRRRERLLEELARHPLFILVRQQGNALIMALCEDPQEVKLAATPAESLLATDKLAGCDAAPGRRMVAAARLSPELVAVSQAANAEPTTNLAAGISAVFSRLSEQEPAHQEVYSRAAAGMSYLGSELQKLSRQIAQPTTLQVWCDGNLHVCASCDARGGSYRPGELRLAALASAPQTALYAESTPMQCSCPLPNGKAVLEAAMAAAEGFALTLATEGHEKAVQALTAVKALMPELTCMAAAGSTIASGLNGQLALVMDSAMAPLPAMSTAQQKLDAESPRVAIYAGVSERSKLAEGWDALKACAGQVAETFGAPAQIVQLLPINARQVGAAMSYSLALPFFTQDAVPSVAVTDTGLSVGSSVNLTTQVAESATGTTPFAGAAFALKFEPLATTLRSLATALDHDAEEAIPVATSDVRLEKEKGTPVATISGADGPTSLFLCCNPAEHQDAADSLSTAAAIAEFAATVADGVYGTATTEGERHILHLEVRMKARGSNAAAR